MSLNSGPASNSVNIVNTDDSNVGWTLPEKQAMTSFLATHKAEAGNGFNFKDTTRSKVADHLRPMRTEGEVKIVNKCREKWGWVHFHSIELKAGLL